MTLPIPVWAVKLDSAFPSIPTTSFPPHESLLSILDFLDSQSAAQIQKYRHLADAQRCCLGRLLPRFLLASRFQLPWMSLRFDTTATGRPYAIHPKLPPGLDYNISHDSNWTVLAWNVASDTERNAERVGVDIMRVRIPWEGGSVEQFIEGLRDQVTLSESQWLQSSISDQHRLSRIFALWTLKEAYTKALGVGIGFEFNRIEITIQGSIGQDCEIAVSVDQILLVGWEFGLRWIDEEHLVAVAVEREEPSHTEHIRFFTLQEMLELAAVHALEDKRL